jgi:hypothetical protein
LQIISAAEAAGHARVAEMNKQVAVNLDKIITALETGSGAACSVICQRRVTRGVVVGH